MMNRKWLTPQANRSHKKWIRQSQTMRTWVEELRANVDDKKLVIAIAITKSDLDENRAETRRKAEEFASSINDA